MSNEWNRSEVMKNFIKIAEEEGLISSDFSLPPGEDYVGNASSDVKQWTRAKVSEEYNVTDGTGKDIIEKAHPKKVEIADSQGEGGVVENILEQQQKSIDIATKMPRGTLIGVHAALEKNLEKLSKDLKFEGNIQAANRVKKTLGVLKKKSWLPAIPLTVKLIGLGLGLAGVSSTWGAKLISLQENLSTDIADLLEILDSAVEDSPEFSKIASDIQSELTPYKIKFSEPIPSPQDETELSEYLTALQTFGASVFPKVKTLVEAITSSGDEWYKFGLGAKDRLKAALDNLKTSYENTLKAIQNIIALGSKVSGNRLNNNIAEVQNVLGIAQTGILDEKTKQALKNIESQVENTIGDVAKKRGWEISGSLLRSDGSVISASSLKRLIHLIKERQSM